MISRAQEGFEYEAITARKAAQSGDTQSMVRQLAAAHALAVWADTTLLKRYQALEAERWKHEMAEAMAIYSEVLLPVVVLGDL